MSLNNSNNSNFKQDDIDTIIKKVEYLKRLYYSPNIYKICSLEPEDIETIFFGNQYIYIKNENFYDCENKTTENKKEYLFKCFINFIYIDITDIDIIIHPEKYYNDNINENIINQIQNELVSNFKDKIKEYQNKFLIKDVKSYLTIYEKIHSNKRSYIEYNKNSKKLFIKNFIDLILEILKTNYITNDDNNFLIKIIIKILSEIKIDKIKVFNQNDISNFYIVDNILKKYSNDTIITYLKIRNTPVKYTLPNSNTTLSTSLQDYNKTRFNVSLYGNAGSFTDTLLIKYNKNFKTFNVEEQIVQNAIYTNEYLFGPFNRIYNFTENNKDISNNLNDIVHSLENNKDVFIIGYGASGSGKTSTLVYLKTDQEIQEGIIIHVCKNLTKTYKKFNVKCREFYTENDINNIRKIPENDNESISFTYSNNNILLDNEYKYVPKWIIENDKEKIKTFNKGDNIGDVILYLIDKDRFVEPTTNNPKSSRSHSLVFIELIGENDKKANFIIGDFAGVENKFDCHENNAENFYKINTGNINSNDNYYSKKFENEYKEQVDDKFNDIYYKILDIDDKSKNYDFITNIILQNFFNIIYKQNEKDKGLKQDIRNYINDNVKINYNEIKNIFKEDIYENKIKDIFKEDIKNILIKEKNNINKNLDKTLIDETFQKYFNGIIDDLNKVFDEINELDIKTEKKKEKIQKLPNQKLQNQKIIEMINFSKLDKLNYLALYTNNKKLDPEYSFIIYLKKFIKNNSNDIINYWKGLFNTVMLEIKDQDIKEYEKTKNKSKEEAKDKSRKEYIKKICDTRTKEGIYINKSLEDVRSFITFLLKEKNKNKISISPQFINKCFPYYCNTDKCFDINTLEGNSNSIIFKEIINVLKYNTTEDYIKKLIISVFCVFNISVNVNNPPPVPYVDINNIQIIFNKYNHNNDSKHVNLSEYNNILVIECNKIIKLLNDYSQNEASKYTELQKERIESFINKEYSEGIHESIDRYVTELINYFNNFNSISSIGTLEFLDKLSKFNLTNVICGISYS